MQRLSAGSTVNTELGGPEEIHYPTKITEYVEVKTTYFLSRISGSQGDEDEDGCLLGCSAV
jgi:hypothetical protein